MKTEDYIEPNFIELGGKHWHLAGRYLEDLPEKHIIDFDKKAMKAAKKEGWKIEPFRGSKPEPEPVEGRPILMVVEELYRFTDGGKGVAPCDYLVFTSGFKTAKDAYNALKPDRLHFTGATVYDS